MPISRASRTLLAGAVIVTGLVAVGAGPASAVDCVITQVASAPSADEFSTQGELQALLDVGCAGGTLVANFTEGFADSNQLSGVLTWGGSDPLVLQPASPSDSPVLESDGTDAILTDVGGAAQLTVDGLTLSGGNSTAGRGGAISWSGPVSITNSTVSGNTAAADGGGIWATGPIEVIDSVVTGNTATGGAGGGLGSDGSVTATRSAITGNSSGGGTGGGGITSSSSVTLTDSTVSGNSTANGLGGGGVWASSEVVATNSTITENNSTAEGGGFWTFGSATLNFSSVTQNQATGNGTNVFANDSGVSATGSVIGSPGATQSCYAGAALVGSYNATISGDSCAFSGTANVSSTWAQLDLGMLADNGGPTLTQLPGADSSLIGIVPESAGAALTPPVVADQRGVTRTGSAWWAGPVQGTTPTPPPPTPDKQAQEPSTNCVAPGSGTKLPATGSRALTRASCATNAGQVVGTTVLSAKPRVGTRGDSRLFKLYCKVGSKHRKTSSSGYGAGSRYCTQGALRIRTYGTPLKVRIQWHAPATDEFTAFTTSRAFKS